VNILYDAAMPYAEAFFAGFGNAKAFEVGSLSAESLIDVDALFVRSTTKVDANLLSKANKLSFVATATAGYNHLDINYLKLKNINWYAAGGCNAIAVAEYVLSALLQLTHEDKINLFDKKVAIIGAGNVGTVLANLLGAVGITYVLCDPPLKNQGDQRDLVSFEQAMMADIICLHTPLIEKGDDPTLHMIGSDELANLSENQYLINACRGEVIDNLALLESFESGKRINVVLDVWEQEPLIEHKLIPFVRLATAHIAGHTLEGKARGTSMVYDAFCCHLDRPSELTLEQFLPAYEICLTLDPSISAFEQLFYIVKSRYDIKKDDGIFRSRMAKSQAFSQIRKSYPVRREFSAGSVCYEAENTSKINNKHVAKIAASLGFTIAN
jgi:erythronate-4-phosphate dehydrogenase